MKTNEIYLGDAYKLIKEMPDKSVDLIYTDMPYLYVNGGKGAGLLKNEKRKELYSQTIANFNKGIDYSILDDFVRVMKHIYIYIWCSREQILPLMKYFIEEKGCIYDLLVWVKTNCTPFSNNTYLPNLEYCLLFREPNATSLNHSPAGSLTKKKYYISGTNVEDKKKYLHATIKPLEYVKNHLKNSTKEGDIVLDPFVGSGTTALAAKELGRQYIGFEINEKYYNIAKDRLNGINQKGEIDLFNYEQLDLFK